MSSNLCYQRDIVAAASWLNLSLQGYNPMHISLTVNPTVATEVKFIYFDFYPALAEGEAMSRAGTS